MSGAGSLYMHGIALLIDLEYPVIWERYIHKDIHLLLRGWDDWNAEFGMRIENLKSIDQSLIERVKFDTGNFKQELEELLKPDFFDLIKVFKNPDHLSKISEYISVLSKKALNFESNRLIIRIRNNLDKIIVFNVLIGILIVLFVVIRVFFYLDFIV